MSEEQERVDDTDILLAVLESIFRQAASTVAKARAERKALKQASSSSSQPLRKAS